MFKKAALFLTLMLLLPTLASAYTVMVKVGSGSGSVTLTSPTQGTAITSTGSVSVAGTNSAVFTLAPTNGYTVSKILLDNVAVYDKSAVTPLPAGPTSTQVTYNSAKLIRSLTVYYSVLPSYYTVNVNPAVATGTGYVLLQKVVNINGTWQASGSSSQSTLGSLKIGDYVRITAIPATDYACTNFQVNGTSFLPSPAPGVGEAASTIYQVTGTPANVSVAANFTISPKLSAVLQVYTDPATKLGASRVAAGSTVYVDASGSTGNVALTYNFTASGGTLSGTGAVRTFTAAAGTYTISATVSGGTPTVTSTPATFTIQVLSAADYANQACTVCHNADMAKTAAINVSYDSSEHAARAISCDNCHQAATNHPGTVNSTTVSTTTFKALTSAGPAAKGQYFCWNATCHASKLTTDLVAITASSHFAQRNGSNCSSCHGTDMHAQDGQFTNKCGKCHDESAKADASKHATAISGYSCRSCHTGAVGYGYQATPTIVGSSMTFTRPSSASASKHRAETFAYATSDACAKCHGDIRTEFRTTAHWNNHLEVGPEFAGGAVPEQMNANESWTTTENGAATTCAIRCHFKPNLGPDPKAKNTNATLSPGKDECLACHDPHTLAASYLTCHDCHRQTSTTRAENTSHGLVPYEFYQSKHWKNTFEYGPEFDNQLNISYAKQLQVSDAVVVSHNTYSSGRLNPNDSYTATENGVVKTCAYRCHFRPGLGPNKDVPNYLANGKATTYVTYTDTTGKYGEAGKVYSRPGGNACLACHNEHSLEASAQSTCYTCHAGSVTSHGWSVAEFEKSSHFNGAHAGSMRTDSCIACHNAHSTEAEFANASTATTLHTAGFATGCQKCHTPGTRYSIYSSNGIMKKGHAPGLAILGSSSKSTVSYIQPDDKNSAQCVDCHYHNNTINAGWAEGGHGYLGDDPAKSFRFNHAGGTSKVDWKVSPQASRCSTCHSPKGYAQFVDSNFTNISTVAPIKATVNGIANVSLYSPLTCDACHVAKSAGTAQYNGTLRNTKQYTNYNGYSTATIVPKKLITTEVFPNWGNSNTCIPCHTEGRGTSTRMVKKLFAADTPEFKQYSAGSVGIHALPAAGVVNATSGYEFPASSQGYKNRMKHASIGQADYRSTGTSGPCVACHYRKTDATHSLEAVTYDATGAINGIVSTTCAKCHPTEFTYQDVAKAKANFQAALKVLGNLLVSNNLGTLDAATGKFSARKLMDPTRADGNVKVTGGVAEKNMGAIANYNLFTNSEAETGAYVHNPAWARKLVFDSIDWLDDGVMNGSSSNTVIGQANRTTVPAGQVAVSTVEGTNAVAFTNDPGCLGCHGGPGTGTPPVNSGANTATGEDIPAIGADGKHYAPEGTTNAQYVSSRAQCNYCHGYGHGTDSPGGTVLADFAESGHAAVAGAPFAEAGDDFKNMDTCNACHTATGFVKYVNSKFTDAKPWGTTGDATREIIACNACHSSTTWASSVRAFDTYSAGYGGFGSAAKQKIGYAYGKSNVCVPCHAARETGDTLSMITNFANSSFKNPHYLGAAGILAAKVGFHYFTDPAKYAYSTFKHDKIGMNNYSSVSYYKPKLADGVTTNPDPASWSRNYDYSQNTGTDGPCVACHMNNSKSHTLSFNNLSLSMPASNGYSTQPAGQGCYGCHGTEVMATVVEEEKEKFNSAMALFQAVLAANGMVYSDAYPYFYAADGVTALKNWTAVGPTTDGKLNMGAAFNFKLVKAEKGSFVHNRKYTKRLIYDSINYLQNGSVTGTINFTNLSSVTQPVSAARAYLGTARP